MSKVAARSILQDGDSFSIAKKATYDEQIKACSEDDLSLAIIQSVEELENIVSTLKKNQDFLDLKSPVFVGAFQQVWGNPKTQDLWWWENKLAVNAGLWDEGQPSYDGKPHGFKRACGSLDQDGKLKPVDCKAKLPALCLKAPLETAPADFSLPAPTGQLIPLTTEEPYDYQNKECNGLTTYGSLGFALGAVHNKADLQLYFDRFNQNALMQFDGLVGIRKAENGKYIQSDGLPLPDDPELWLEGEPKEDGGECVAISREAPKLKAVQCGDKHLAMCAHQDYLAWFSTEKASFDSAKYRCRQIGPSWQLAIALVENEFPILQNRIGGSIPSLNGLDSATWVGVEQQLDTGYENYDDAGWNWINGPQVDISDKIWHSESSSVTDRHQPDDLDQIEDGDEDCGALYRSEAQFRLDDQDCDLELYFLCQSRDIYIDKSTEAPAPAPVFTMTPSYAPGSYQQEYYETYAQYPQQEPVVFTPPPVSFDPLTNVELGSGVEAGDASTFAKPPSQDQKSLQQTLTEAEAGAFLRVLEDQGVLQQLSKKQNHTLLVPADDVIQQSQARRSLLELEDWGLQAPRKLAFDSSFDDTWQRQLQEFEDGVLGLTQEELLKSYVLQKKWTTETLIELSKIEGQVTTVGKCSLRVIKGDLNVALVDGDGDEIQVMRSIPFNQENIGIIMIAGVIDDPCASGEGGGQDTGIIVLIAIVVLLLVAVGALVGLNVWFKQRKASGGGKGGKDQQADATLNTSVKSSGSTGGSGGVGGMDGDGGDASSNGIEKGVAQIAKPLTAKEAHNLSRKKLQYEIEAEKKQEEEKPKTAAEAHNLSRKKLEKKIHQEKRHKRKQLFTGMRTGDAGRRALRAQQDAKASMSTITEEQDSLRAGSSKGVSSVGGESKVWGSKDSGKGAGSDAGSTQKSSSRSATPSTALLEDSIAEGGEEVEHTTASARKGRGASAQNGKGSSNGSGNGSGGKVQESAYAAHQRSRKKLQLQILEEERQKKVAKSSSSKSIGNSGKNGHNSKSNNNNNGSGGSNSSSSKAAMMEHARSRSRFDQLQGRESGGSKFQIDVRRTSEDQGSVYMSPPTTPLQSLNVVSTDQQQSN